MTPSKKAEQAAESAENAPEPSSAPPAPQPPAGPPTVGEHGAKLPKREAWRHAAAEALHRWRAHAHHTGAPMRLSEQDYAAALAAAEKPDATGHYKPHAPALSPHGAAVPAR